MMPLITRLLSAPDQHMLLPLLAAYGAEMAPHLAGAAPATAPEMLKLITADPRAEILGAFRGDEALGFALVVNGRSSAGMHTHLHRKGVSICTFVLL